MLWSLLMWAYFSVRGLLYSNTFSPKLLARHSVAPLLFHNGPREAREQRWSCRVRAPAVTLIRYHSSGHCETLYAWSCAQAISTNALHVL